jgi:hypothetical protein
MTPGRALTRGVNVETLRSMLIPRVLHTRNHHDEQSSHANGRQEADGAHRSSRDPPGHHRPHRQPGAATATAGAVSRPSGGRSPPARGRDRSAPAGHLRKTRRGPDGLRCVRALRSGDRLILARDVRAYAGRLVGYRFTPTPHRFVAFSGARSVVLAGRPNGSVRCLSWSTGRGRPEWTGAGRDARAA